MEIKKENNINYITGKHALNVHPDKCLTVGDWHEGVWTYIRMFPSKHSLYLYCLTKIIISPVSSLNSGIISCFLSLEMYNFRKLDPNGELNSSKNPLR
jgi:hypothetical protein